MRYETFTAVLLYSGSRGSYSTVAGFQGGPVLELLEKAQHDLPMLSLAAVGSEAELMQWRQKLGNYVSSRSAGAREIVCEGGPGEDREGVEHRGGRQVVAEESPG